MSELQELRRGMLGRATIGDQLRRHAQHDPDKQAVVYHGPKGRNALTYGALNERVNALTVSLRRLGIGRGDVVAVMSRNSPDYITTWFATLKLGAVLTGINFTFTEDDVVYQATHSEAKAFVVEDTFVPGVEAIRDRLPGVAAFVYSRVGSDDPAPEGWHDFAELVAEPGPEPEVEIDEDDPAMLIYTSGTTEFPKGVLISHRNYLISTTPAWTHALGLGPHVVWLFVMPFFTIAGLGSMTSIFTCGATIVLVHAVDPQSALAIIRDERVTYMAQTPTFFLAMTQADGFAGADFSYLQRCITYGGTVPKHMIDAWREAAPEVMWGTYWGQSELSQLGSVGWFSSLDDVPGGDPAWIGKPVPQLEIRIVDDDGNDAEQGELICRSPSVMLGYLKDEERTRTVFRDGWLHTEDIVRRDADGNLFFVDRTKDVIKSGGMNVSSVEIERVLYQHPALQEVAVVGIPDDYWSEAVTAFVIAKPGTDVDPGAVVEHCRERLAGFKVPKAVHLVESLPKDTQGKILKRELRANHTPKGATA